MYIRSTAMTQMSTSSSHPYYPPDAIIPGYAANETPLPVLLAAFGGTLGFAVLGAAFVVARNNKCGGSALALFCWFFMNACLHCVFEGYFVLNHAALASSQSLLAQLWKEYALSDSRYLTSDVFILSVESITAFIWGPLCLFTAVSIACDSPRQHGLRIIACVAHLYGVALYYATSQCEWHFTRRSHSRPEVLYFWVYYVGFNLPWAIVPVFILLDSLKTITRALRALDKAEATLRRTRESGLVVAAAAHPTTEEPKKTR
ncbi:Emopamil-binding protein [Xylariaceae sp. FL0594]|nr:Emopamil-binding protein [Xylariaceae sp. FL0594]